MSQQQLELMARGGLELAPEPCRTEPRLWVKRIIIWNSPPEITREIHLRPGLNIVWSPDPAENPTAEAPDLSTLGHGSGKTLLCRLIRYCLGEPRFAPDGQRHQLANRCPDALVGADIIINGTSWAVVRPIGTRRQHFAMQGGSLEEIADGKHDATGIECLHEALSSLVFTPDALPLMPTASAADAWLVALAWLTRDQECRFDKELDWRSSDSDSGSPARGLSVTSTLDAVRVLMKAITAEEKNARQEESRLEGMRKSQEQRGTSRDGELARLITKLTKELDVTDSDLPQGSVFIELLRKSAVNRLGDVALLPAADKRSYEALAEKAAASRQRVSDLRSTYAGLDASIPRTEELCRRIEAEIPGGSAELFRARNVACPLCEVPIDRVLAENCQLSHKLPNMDELTERWSRTCQEVDAAKERLREEHEKRNHALEDLRVAQLEDEIIQAQLKDAERARYDKLDTWYKARRLLDDVDRLDELLVEQENAQLETGTYEIDLEQARQRLAAFRDAQANVFERLTAKFDAILRSLLGENARGTVRLDGVGLKTTLTLNGERSTAAINSLKVIAFDLAALCLSIEGQTLAPAFLLHDSPREADLGLSVYHRLVSFVDELEQISSPPLFQYILTTTTRPPKNLCGEPWLVCQLEGNPAAERLMRLDL